MRYPGYLLNPGDMFQVDPERVMFATGAGKNTSDESPTDEVPKSRSEDAEDAAPTSQDQSEESKEEEAEEAEEAEEEEKDPRTILRDLLVQAKSIIEHPKGGKLNVKMKQNLRAFQKQVKSQLSRRDSTTEISDDLEAQFEQLTNQLQRQPNYSPSDQQQAPPPAPPDQEESTRTTTTTTTEQTSEPSTQSTTPPLTPTELTLLRDALTRLQHNPPDASKPYATPWTPRPYMSAFAFIPAFLEVNQSICAAVYLRHPVARPGFAEVPTPFNEITGGNAFAWYLRRR
jgi:ribosomal protein S4